MFISIHLNHFSESKYYGAQVWYSGYKDSATLAGIIQKNLRMDLDPSNKRVQKPAKNSYGLVEAPSLSTIAPLARTARAVGSARRGDGAGRPRPAPRTARAPR